MDWGETFEQVSIHAILALRYFLYVALSDSMCFITPGPCLTPCNSFFMIFIQAAFIVCPLRSHILLQNCSTSFALGCCTFVFSYFLVEFSFVFEGPLLIVLLDSTSYLLSPWSLDLSLQVVLLDLSAVFFLSFNPNIILCSFLPQHHR